MALAYVASQTSPQTIIIITAVVIINAIKMMLFSSHGLNAHLASRASFQFKVIIMLTIMSKCKQSYHYNHYFQPWPERRPRHIWPAELPLKDQHGASASREDGQQHTVRNMMMMTTMR